MSKVLSVYNDWAFYEVVLPAASNTEYSFLLDAGLFHLRRNEIITLECIHGEWHFSDTKNGLYIEPVGAKISEDAVISEYGRYNLEGVNFFVSLEK